MGVIKRTLELGLIGYISIAGGMFTADKLMSTHKDKYSLEGEINPYKAAQVTDWIKSLYSGEKATLHIETYGGHEVSAYKIAYYIKNTKADLTCFVDSHAMSAGAIILDSCRKIVVTPKAQILFHLPRYGDQFGNVTLANKEDISYRLTEEVIDSCRFLNDQERKDVLEGKDVKILGRDIMERLR